MDSIVLHVYLLTDDREKEKLFAACPPVEGVNLAFATVPGNEELPDISGIPDVLLWTEDRARIAAYEKDYRDDMGIVLCTDEKNLTDLGPNLELWPLGENAEMQQHRFHRLILRVTHEFQHWLRQNWLMATIDTMQDLVWYKSADGLHWLVNNKFEDTVHKTRAQVHGMGHNYIWDVPPEDCGKSEFRCLESEREVMEKKQTCVSDELVKTAKGMRHFLTYKTPLYDRNGDVMGTVGIGHDVTDLNNASLEIQMLMENLPFPVVMCDEKFGPVQINSRFVQDFSVEKSQIGSWDYQAWKKETFQPEGERIYHSENHTYTQELSLEIEGKQRIFTLTEQEILDYFGEVSSYYCSFVDVTIERSYEKMILTYANMDTLTQLFNRRYFFEYVNQQPEEMALTVLFMDMDNFKRVNDTLGHAMGDAVLVSAANIIKEAFPEGLVARLGGDEFAVAIVGAAQLENLRQRVNLLRSRIEDAFAHMKLGVSVSVGIAQSDHKPEDVDTFLIRSDEEMYKEKQTKHPERK